MKVSLKAVYGIMAALDLALHNGTSPVRAKSIARRQAIPARFLEQVLHAMKNAGLVDIKVVSFSETHTAEKFVIPRRDR